MSQEVYEERGRRLKVAHTDALARQPKFCPLCGSDNVTPTFVGDAWECSDCPNVWETVR